MALKSKDMAMILSIFKSTEMVPTRFGVQEFLQKINISGGIWSIKMLLKLASSTVGIRSLASCFLWQIWLNWMSRSGVQSWILIVILYFILRRNLKVLSVCIASTLIGKKIYIRWHSFPMSTHRIAILWALLIFLMVAIQSQQAKSHSFLKGSQAVDSVP